MAGTLPPPPIGEPQGSYAWEQWYQELARLYQAEGTIPWSSVDKTGSTITDIVTRAHNSLQSLQGGTAAEYYHLTGTEYTALTGANYGTWTPSFTNLTEVLGGGSVTKTGRWARAGRVVTWQVRIVTAGGATHASTAGTTYHDLPVAATQDDVSVAANASTLLGVGTGYLDSTNDRNYPPSWTATTETLILSGKYEV